MELWALLIGVFVGFLAVLLLVRGKQSTYKSHVAQLVPDKQKRQLPIGMWTREEVAKHSSAEDAWIIVQDRDDGIFKARKWRRRWVFGCAIWATFCVRLHVSHLRVAGTWPWQMRRLWLT
jgi:hypothetical protein